MSLYHSYPRGSGGAPTFKVFEEGFSSGLDNLPAALTINGTTVYPTFRYRGDDATASEWAPWDYGDTLPIAGAGSDPTVGRNTPLTSNNLSVLFNTAKCFRHAGTSFGDVTTEDMVLELVFQATSSVSAIFEKLTLATIGWSVYMSGGTFHALIQNGSGSADTASGALVDRAYYHAMVFLNRNQASADGFRIYLNSAVNGSGADPSAISGSISNASLFAVGAQSGLASPYDRHLAYLAMWKGQDWLDTGAQAAVAKERAARVMGVFPQVARGTATPTSMTRASTAYLDIERSGVRELFLMGTNWMRVAKRADANDGYITGYLSEPQKTNLVLRSQDITNWTNFETSDAGDSAIAPDGTTTADHYIASATNNYHSVFRNDVSVTNAVTYTASAWFKTRTHDYVWVGWDIAGVQRVSFDITNGVVGQQIEGSAATSSIEDWGGGWFRCSVTVTSTATISNAAISVGIAPDLVSGLSFLPAGTESVYVWGVQIEATECATSYYPTTTATATRSPDVLTYKGDDGNLGGAGSNKRFTIAADVLVPNHDHAAELCLWALSDATAPGDGYIEGSVTAGGDVFRSDVVVDTVNTARVDGTTNISDGVIHSVRSVVAVNNVKTIIDGTQEGTPDTSCDLPDDLDQIGIGQNRTSADQPGGIVSNLRIYKRPTLKG